MSIFKPKKKKYNDSRTKQSFKDETDINKILQRFQVTGTITHLNQHQAKYGDFANINFADTHLLLAEGETLFNSLPSEIRNEFEGSPDAFFAYVNDPANQGKLKELLPELAQPGRQNVDIGNSKANLAAKAAAEPPVVESAEIAQPTPTPAAQAANPALPPVPNIS